MAECKKIVNFVNFVEGITSFAVICVIWCKIEVPATALGITSAPLKIKSNLIVKKIFYIEKFNLFCFRCSIFIKDLKTLSKLIDTMFLQVNKSGYCIITAHKKHYNSLH